MAKYKIEWRDDSDDDEKTVEADTFTDSSDGEWIDFIEGPDGHPVLRVRARRVESIERQADA